VNAFKGLSALFRTALIRLRPRLPARARVSSLFAAVLPSGAGPARRHGQDYNKRAFATTASDMLMKEADHNGGGENIQFGDSFLDDKFKRQSFDYFIANPPDRLRALICLA
jgi:hypothetical protein